MAVGEGNELFEKTKWIFRLIAQLYRLKFSGTLMLEFHEGNLSRKYKRQIIETATDT